MNTTTTISTWTGLVQQFLPIFTTPTGEIFFRLLTGWILCTARRTVTGIIPFADPMSLRAHDAYHRFFPDAGAGKTLAASGDNACPEILPNRDYYFEAYSVCSPNGHYQVLPIRGRPPDFRTQIKLPVFDSKNVST
jgi:hypothetical protein